MKLVSIPERDVQVATLMEYFGAANDGEDLSWPRIEADNRIKMDATGKSLVRRALHKLKRPYAAVRGEGVRLSSAETTMTIIGARFARIDSSVRRADRTRQHLNTRHFEQLDNTDKNRMLVLAGFFGAVRAFAKEASSKLLSERNEKTSTGAT